MPLHKSPGDGCSRSALVGDVVERNSDGEFALLVTRGSCDFATKALNAQASGAAALIVGNSRTSLNSQFNTTLVNQSCSNGGSLIYSCANGRALIQVGDHPCPHTLPTCTPVHTHPPPGQMYSHTHVVLFCLQLLKPGADQNDPACTSTCPSQQCLLTGNTLGAQQEVCCGFDLPMTMGCYLNASATKGPNHTFSNASCAEVRIPAVFLTILESARLVAKMGSSGTDVVEVQIYIHPEGPSPDPR
jgi:hypothetical protein